MYISKGIYLWLVLSSVIVLFDASYVLLRPHSLKGGQYEWLFEPYQIYIQFDTLYGDNNDPFVVIQSWLNLAEIAMAFLAVGLSVMKSEKAKLRGALLAIIVSAFTFWKTVIYVWYAHPFLTEQAKSLNLEAFKYFHLPTSFWLICPIWTILSVGCRISKQTQGRVEEKKKKKQ